MKHIQQIALIATFTLLGLHASAQWTTLNLSIARSEMAGAYIQGKVLFAGGFTKIDNAPEVSAVVDMYDIATGLWSVAQLSSPRARVGSVVLNNKVLFVGGLTPGTGSDLVASTTIDIYDAATGIWSQQTLPQPYAGLRGEVIGSKAYFVSDAGPIEDVIVYDGVTNTWSELALPGGPRRNVGIAVLGDKLFCVAGAKEFDILVEDLNIYNTSTNAWSYKQIGAQMEGAEAITVGDTCYFIGGGTSFSTFASLQYYVGATNSLNYGQYFTARLNHALGVHNGFIYIGGSGLSRADSERVDVYNTSDQTFNDPGSLVFPPGDVEYWKLTAVSTPVGVFFGGGETNYFTTLGINKNVFVIPALVVGTHQPELQTLTIEPTLATESLQISWPAAQTTADAVIEIMDIAGRTYRTVKTTGGDTACTIAVADLPAGYYAVRLTTATGIWAGRFVKP